MDENKPPVSPPSKRISADLDAAPARSDERAGVEPRGLPGQNESCRYAPSVAVYYRNEAEVRDGFLIALRAMGIAVAEQHNEPARPPVRDAEP
jgi:hypothetical protein